MPRIDIYTTPYCGFCTQAKRLLRSKNVNFNEIDVSTDRSLREKMIVRTGGGYTVPQIFIGDHHIGGCSELMNLEQQGDLEALLAS